MKIILVLLIMLFYNLGNSQNWDYLNFPNHTDTKPLRGSCIDNLNNLYSIETNSSGLLVLQKYNNGLALPSSVQFPPKISFSGSKFNHICTDNINVYAGGSEFPSNGTFIKGKLFKADNSLSSITLLSTITCSHSNVSINGVSVAKDALYIVGNFATKSSVGNASFGPFLSIQTANNSNFLAKYSLLTNNWEWVRLFDNVGYSVAQDVALDDNNNIYVTGYFYNSITFYEGNNSYPYNCICSSQISGDNFLVRFNSLGEFDNIWGLKQMHNNANIDMTFDVKIDFNAVYFIGGNNIHKYSISSTGPLIWQKQIPPSPNGAIDIIQLGFNSFNECENMYALGTTNLYWTGPNSCNSSFSLISMIKSLGAITNWTSLSSATQNFAQSVLVGSDNKVHIMGNYGSGGGSYCKNVPPMKIDGNNNLTSPNTNGIFIGRIDDSETNTCCIPAKAEAHFANPNQVVQMNSKYGPGNVSIFCLSDSLLVDGSQSTCEKGYFVGLNEFDLMNWKNVGLTNPLFSNWVSSTAQAPNNINITDFLPQGYQLKPNIVYKFRLAVGTPWDATDLFFMIDCCNSNP